MINIQQKISNKIFLETEQIRIQYPEIYDILTETPLFLSDNLDTITLHDFEQYLESLQTQTLHLKYRFNFK